MSGHTTAVVHGKISWANDNFERAGDATRIEFVVVCDCSAAAFMVDFIFRW